MGRAARRKWEARLEALTTSMASLSSKPTGKPIDSWLGIASFVVGIVFGLTEKTPASIVFWLLVIFGLLVHPIWNFWWIEKSKVRQILALVVLAIALVIFGYNQLPGPVIVGDAQLCSNTKALAARMRDFESERQCQMDAIVNQHRTPSDEAKSQEEKDKAFKRLVDNLDDLRRSMEYDFATKYLPAAKNFRAELLARLPPHPQDKYIDEGAFSGLLAGIRPISNTADQLDLMATRLCPIQ